MYGLYNTGDWGSVILPPLSCGHPNRRQSTVIIDSTSYMSFYEKHPAYYFRQRLRRHLALNLTFFPRSILSEGSRGDYT